MYRMGVDLGGTKIEGIVLDDAGRECFRKRVPTAQERGYEAILDTISALYDTMREPIGGREHTFGIGTPGAISPRTGLLRNSNTVCMNAKPLKGDLEARLGRSIVIENDANCFAMAEALHGAGKGHSTVFGVILGTGCGGGWVVQGHVHTGRMAIGGEWGHMSVNPDGPLCYCGQRGCVETYISGGGLEKRYAERYLETRTLRSVEEGYYRGEPRAREFMAGFFQQFGRCLANLINVLDPDVVVLGGGVSKFEALYTEGVEQVRRFVFSDYLDTPIVRHAIGDSAGVLGAALIGR